jgi:outer membrane protein assembly factor BamB
LAQKAAAELIQPLATPVAVAGQTAFAADAKGRLTSFALPALTPGEDWDLSAAVTRGPSPAGDCVLVATRDNQLYCFDGKPSQRWQKKLAYGPLAGDPLLVGDKLILASLRGVVWSINPADGQELNKVDLQQPLGSAPVPAGDELIVAGADGVLHRIKSP